MAFVRVLLEKGACPAKEDIQTFIDAYAKAYVTGDQVGEGNAVTAAFQAGCVTEQKGVVGLVIDTSGFLEGYDELRMDDGSAVWTIRKAVGDLSGPMHPQ